MMNNYIYSISLDGMVLKTVESNGKLATIGYQPDVWKEWK